MQDKTIRDLISPEDGDVDPEALMDAWLDRKLMPIDEHGRTLKNAYAGMETPSYRRSMEIISRGAELLGSELKVAEAALEAARQTAMLRSIAIVESFKQFSAFAVINAIRDEMEKSSNGSD